MITNQVDVVTKFPVELLVTCSRNPSGSFKNLQWVSRNFVRTVIWEKLSMSRNSSLLSVNFGHVGKLLIFPTAIGNFLLPRFGFLYRIWNVVIACACMIIMFTVNMGVHKLLLQFFLFNRRHWFSKRVSHVEFPRAYLPTPLSFRPVHTVKLLLTTVACNCRLRLS